MFEDKDHRIWMATHGTGVYCYDKQNNTIEHFGVTEGLAGETVYGFTQDNAGSICSCRAWIDYYFAQP